MVADVTYVGRMGLHLQRERNINQLQPGTVQANPGVNANALRPYKGFATIRLSENAGRSIYHGLQLNLERRFRSGLGFGVAYTLSRCATTPTTSATSSTTPTTTAAYWGISDNDRTHVFNVHYLYELPFWRKQDTLAQEGARRLAGLGRDVLPVRRPLSICAQRRHRGRRRHDRAAVGPGRRSEGIRPGVLARDRTSTRTSGSTRRLRAPGARHVRQRRPQRAPRTRTRRAGTSRSSRTSRWAGPQRLQLRLEAFNFPNHPNLEHADRPTRRAAAFGRVTAKNGNRNVQLGVKFMF